MKAHFRISGIILVLAGTTWADAVAAEAVPAASPGPSPWSIELGSGLLWSNVRDSRIPGNNLVPFEATLSRELGPTCLGGVLGGIFKARPEFVFRAHWTQEQRGVENHVAGFATGLRYDFINVPGVLHPYAEATVGAAFADSQPYVQAGRAYGLGQDFNFNFNVAAGFRFDLSDRWFTRAAVVYQHYSNGGLSEPEHSNRAIDALGFVLSVGRRF